MPLINFSHVPQWSLVEQGHISSPDSIQY